jgi:hypothetical protein
VWMTSELGLANPLYVQLHILWFSWHSSNQQQPCMHHPCLQDTRGKGWIHPAGKYTLAHVSQHHHCAALDLSE